MFHFIRLDFLTESFAGNHSVNLCYVGGMKLIMAENNGHFLVTLGGGLTSNNSLSMVSNGHGIQNR